MALRLATCIQGRQEITKAFMWHLEYLRDVTGLKLPITIAYSNDEDYEAIYDQLRDGDKAIKIKNNPIGNKWNELMKHTSKNASESHIMQVGSDDFLHPDYVKLMNENKFDHAGVNEFLIYSPMHRKAVRHKFDRSMFKLTGGGRVISRKALKKIFPVSELYNITANVGLDNSSEFTLGIYGFKPVLIEFKDAFVDVKSDQNIHSFEEFEGSESVSVDYVESLIPKVEFA